MKNFIFHIVLLIFLVITYPYYGPGRTNDITPGNASAMFPTVNIVVPKADFWTARGIVDSKSAESGERIEIRWAGFFPRYELWYGQNAGDPGSMIGKCHFAHGCNILSYMAPDTNKNGVPDYFVGIVWSSLDYGYDDGYQGYMDRYRHEFEPLLGRYIVHHDLLYYARDPPIDFDTCGTDRELPYRVNKTEGCRKEEVFRSELIECRETEVSSAATP